MVFIFVTINECETSQIWVPTKYLIFENVWTSLPTEPQILNLAEIEKIKEPAKYSTFTVSDLAFWEEIQWISKEIRAETKFKTLISFNKKK